VPEVEDGGPAGADDRRPWDVVIQHLLVCGPEHLRDLVTLGRVVEAEPGFKESDEV
jgi:hypothetical protein